MTSDPGLLPRLREELAERYLLEREIASGGMATVYLAHDRRHDRPVALKVLHGEHGALLGAERFDREVRLLARLRHPFVLPLHDSGEAAGTLYYVMPYVEGETLRERLEREGALPIPEAMQVLRELADALSYAHEQGVVHRDLKPENVLLSQSHVLVADFGIAKALDAAVAQGGARLRHVITTPGVALGTPAYMAPEQALGEAAVDHRADLYTLGILAYESLAGTHPFGTRNANAMVKAHVTEPPPPLAALRPDVPPLLESLVMHLLAKDPRDRPQSAAIVLHQLDGMPRNATESNGSGWRRLLRWVGLGK